MMTCGNLIILELQDETNSFSLAQDPLDLNPNYVILALDASIWLKDGSSGQAR
jgi:hypothetical protein